MKILALKIFRILWKGILFFLIWGILLLPVILFFQNYAYGFQFNYPLLSLLIMEIITLAFVLLSAFIMMKFIERQSFVLLGFHTKNIFKDIIAGFGFGSFWLIFSLIFLFFTGSLIFHPVGSPELLLLLFSFCITVINVLTQQILTRTYLFYLIKNESGVIAALLITSFLFAIMHIRFINGSFLALLNLFIAGLIFGVAYIKSGNIWLSSSIHLSWNWLLGPVAGLSVSGQNIGISHSLFFLSGSPILSGGDFGLEGSIIVTLTGLLILAILLFYPKENTSTPVSNS